MVVPNAERSLSALGFVGAAAMEVCPRLIYGTASCKVSAPLSLLHHLMQAPSSVLGPETFAPSSELKK